MSANDWISSIRWDVNSTVFAHIPAAPEEVEELITLIGVKRRRTLVEDQQLPGPNDRACNRDELALSER